MVILGVDPGTLITGYGVVRHVANRTRVLECGVVKNGSARSMPERLKAIFTKLSDVIEKYQPDEFAIETSFYSKNAQSAMKLGHARGVSLLAAANSDIPTSEYSPREVKKGGSWQWRGLERTGQVYGENPPEDESLACPV